MRLGRPLPAAPEGEEAVAKVEGENGVVVAAVAVAAIATSIAVARLRRRFVPQRLFFRHASCMALRANVPPHGRMPAKGARPRGGSRLAFSRHPDLSKRHSDATL